jgi:hypothetical protein
MHLSQLLESLHDDVFGGRRLGRVEQARKVDRGQRSGALRESPASVRGLRSRQDVTEGMVERDPVAIGGHG